MDPVNDQQLCGICLKIELLRYFRDAIDGRVHRDGFVGPTGKALNLGPFEHLYRKSHYCSFCRLVVRAICTRRVQNRQTPEIIIAESQKAKTQLQCWLYSYLYAENKTRGTILQKAYPIGIATQLNEKDRSSVEEHAGDIQLLAEDAERISGSKLFYGRGVDAARVDLKLLRFWLSYCEIVHGRRCEFPNFTGDGHLNQKPQGILVIDVKRLCLCHLPQESRYVALSYRWPTIDTFLLPEDALDDLLQPQSLGRIMCKLPQKIKDAIHCVADLGEAFLWVDALCIIQDNEAHKKFQILQMDKIYGSALLTLVSASSAKTRDTEICNGFPRYSENKGHVLQEIETVQNLRLAVPFDTVSNVLATSVWDTRAWTYQESLLSKRRLYFTDTQVYFQCSCSVFCEDGIGEGSDPSADIFTGSNLWNMGALYSAQTSTSDFGTAYLSRLPYHHPTHAIRGYENCLADYTARCISNPSDILNAFRGIQTVLEETMDTVFWYGLPEGYLDKALLWTLTRSHKRRDLTSSFDCGSTDLHIPSWTWAGWDSAVELGSYFCITGIQPEALWYSINKDCKLSRIETEAWYRDFEFPQNENKNVSPQGEPPNDSSSIIKSTIGSRNMRPDRETLKHLACWTTLTTFLLTAKEAPLYGHSQIWTTGKNLVIADKKSQWVGSIMMEQSWIANNLAHTKEFEFMLLSRSENIEPLIQSESEYFDERVFTKRPWCLLNVMLIQHENETVTRLGVGFIHEDAWSTVDTKFILME